MDIIQANQAYLATNQQLKRHGTSIGIFGLREL